MEIRKPEQLVTINALIIPGGESTTMAKLAEYHNLVFFFSHYGHLYYFPHFIMQILRNGNANFAKWVGAVF